VDGLVVSLLLETKVQEWRKDNSFLLGVVERNKKQDAKITTTECNKIETSVGRFVPV
jgi:hypothetical protein